MPVPTQGKKTPVAIVDWNTSGHHLTYLREYVLAFAERNVPVVVLSPERPNIAPWPPSFEWREIPTITWIKQRNFLGSSMARWRFAKRLAVTLKEAETALGSRCDRLFFRCLYENQAKIVTRVMPTLGLPCAGLYLQAGLFHSGQHRLGGKRTRSMRRLRQHDLLDTVFMLDETMAGAVSDFLGKPIIGLPDVTDCSLDENHPLPASLGIQPGGRSLIGLLGHLRPSKGMMEMIAFARSKPALNVRFFFAGSCDWHNFSPAEEHAIKDACSKDPRTIFHPHRIPDEDGYNALVRCCAMLWAVYRDSPHTSNTLAKAACFERPVVVADGFQMASQAPHYRLGGVVPQGDAATLERLLERLHRELFRKHSRSAPIPSGRDEGSRNF